MNKNIMRAAGFENEVKRVEAGLCPTCGKEMANEKFKDNSSKREFEISGMCQKCQDDTFGSF